MASETYIISKEIADASTDNDFKIVRGKYYIGFKSDYHEMQTLLGMCKISANMNDIYISGSSLLIELIHHFQLKNYLIEFENDFAGIADESGFIIPVLNAVILNKLIVDESNADFGAFKRAYNAVGFDYPLLLS